MNARCCLAGLCLVLWLTGVHAESCGINGIWVQVLGGAHVKDKGAASSHVIWLDGKARVLIDAGGGSASNFAKSGAHVADLDVILFTQLDVDHTADLPVLIQSSLLESRTRPLPIYGPARSRIMPSTVTFIRRLFNGKRGVYRYLGELVSPLGKGTYKLKPHDVRIKGRYDPNVFRNERMRVAAATTLREPMPTLAWRIQAGGKFIVFSGGIHSSDNLDWLAQGADLLVVHNHRSDTSDDARRSRDTAPTLVAQMAKQYGVKKLVLSHHTPPEAVAAEQTLAAIGSIYRGATIFARDLDCFQP